MLQIPKKLVFFKFYLFSFTYFRGGEVERVSQADSPLSSEPYMGLDLTTKSQTKPKRQNKQTNKQTKSRVRHSSH